VVSARTGAALVFATTIAFVSCGDAYSEGAPTCADGMADCDLATPGCETDIRSSPSHCGFCGNACPTRADGFPICSDRTCTIGCNTGFGDCNGVVEDGCETPLSDDPKNCGACNNECPEQSPVCSGGKCRVSCSGTKADCNADPSDGCEADLESDAAHCGACDAPCAAGGECVAGKCVAPSSCKELADRTPRPPSGVYRLDVDGDGPLEPFDAYCELDPAQDGGGWTLALKVDGSKNTFTYDAPLWANADLLAPNEAALDDTEAKLASYDLLSFKAVRVGLKEGAGPIRWLVILQDGRSLRSVFASRTRIPTALGPAAWRALVDAPSTQPECNAEGFNVEEPEDRDVRIGIAFDTVSSCAGADSFIGIGIRDAQVTAGNVNREASVFRPMMGYVMIR